MGGVVSLGATPVVSISGVRALVPFADYSLAQVCLFWVQFCFVPELRSRVKIYLEYLYDSMFYSFYEETS